MEKGQFSKVIFADAQDIENHEHDGHRIPQEVNIGGAAGVDAFSELLKGGKSFLVEGDDLPIEHDVFCKKRLQRFDDFGKARGCRSVCTVEEPGFVAGPLGKNSHTVELQLVDPALPIDRDVLQRAKHGRQAARMNLSLLCSDCCCLSPCFVVEVCCVPELCDRHSREHAARL